MLLHDLRQAVRGFRRSPTAAAAVLGLTALGIGSVTALFSVVNAVLLRSLPYSDAGRLVVALDDGDFPVSPANFFDLRDAASGSFEDMAAAEMWGPNLKGAGQVEQIPAVRVTANMFRLLGAQTMLGRPIRPDEDRERVVVLSQALWQRRFGGDPGVVGRTIQINSEPYTVIGVTPSGFQFPPFWATGAELWAPLDLAPRRDSRDGNSLRVFGRLKAGVRLERAQAEAAAISARLIAAYPEQNRGLNLVIVPLHEKTVGKVKPMLMVVFAASGLVLLIACANVSALLLARATGRRKEIAIRAALGAGKRDVIRQLLAEAVIQSAAGGALGVLLAQWGLYALTALAPADIPRIQMAAVDAVILAGAVGLSLFAGVFSGLAPALNLAAADLQGVLREESGGSTGGTRRARLRSILTVAEVALALTLTIGAALLVRSFVRLTALDPGFDPQNLLTMTVSVAGTEHSAEGRRLQFFDALQRETASLPGVRSTALINHLPLAGDTWGFRVTTEGEVERGPAAVYRVIEPGYFATMQIRVLHGRDFSPRDDMSAPKVAAVNRVLAERLWPGQSSLGKRLTLDHPQKSPVWLTVTGVVDDVKQAQWSAPPAPEIYLPFRQSTAYLGNPALHYSSMTLVVRTSARPTALAAPFRSVLQRLDKEAPVSNLQTMDEVISRQMSRPRFAMLLVGLFGVVALVLALVGVYCIIAYSVGRRTREIGIRMALGAGRARVVRMVVMETTALVLPGIAAGLLTSLAASRLMSSLLYGITPRDPLTIAVAAGCFSVMIVAAGYLPARRAARVDPAIAIRQG